MTFETPAYRALTESAALGPDFAEGRAAFAERRAREILLSGPDGPAASKP